MFTAKAINKAIRDAESIGKNLYCKHLKYDNPLRVFYAIRTQGTIQIKTNVGLLWLDIGFIEFFEN